MPALEAFVDSLARARVAGPVVNQYALAGNGPASPANGQRRVNLHHYLELTLENRPRAILVGEAPGYRGCRLTGIPFTSERLLVHGFRGEPLFGRWSATYPVGDGHDPVREATATMVWESILDARPRPLLWNAFPFHPHRPGEPLSNRPPTRAELAQGLPFLRRLLNWSGVDTVIAVGRKAQAALDMAGIPFRPLRHPSHGGKAAFTEGLTEILVDLDYRPGRG